MSLGREANQSIRCQVVVGSPRLRLWPTGGVAGAGVDELDHGGDTDHRDDGWQVRWQGGPGVALKIWVTQEQEGLKGERVL